MHEEAQMESRPKGIYYAGGPGGGGETVEFAARELADTLSRMTGGTYLVERREGFSEDSAGLWIGLFSDFPQLDLGTVEDLELDDAVRVDVVAGAGIIAGVNPRSVLFAVYRFLHAAGCRWVRPGPDGELVPRRSLDSLSVRLVERPSYRHRGICIEGAVSFEHVRDMIDWAPKVGFNTYFMQFREGFVFFERWYSHRDNLLKDGAGGKNGARGFTVEEARGLVDRILLEIKKRGLLYHAVGHGWTCEPYGIPGLGWDVYSGEISAEVRQAFAEVNGRRALWQGIPLNTNLCYGAAEVRARIVEDAFAYARDHRELDYLSFCLADGANNHCECPLCRDTRPSDFLVMILNELDARLTAAGIETRVAFPVYVDLFWPPEKQRIRNPDRFLLFFAPITRTYSSGFASHGVLPPPEPYVRNELKFPTSIQGNLTYLAEWRRVFQGDSIEFDYHYIWDHYCDPGYMAVARGLHEDITHLAALGLDGYMSCQVQRAFFPTGLGMTVMGAALWNRELDFDAQADDYFTASFGPDWPAARGHMETLSQVFDTRYLRGEKPVVDAGVVAQMARVPGIVEGFRTVVEQNMGSGDACRAASWKLLAAHGRVCVALARFLAARARGEEPEALARFDDFSLMLWRMEKELHPVLDVFMYLRTLRRKLMGEGPHF